MRCSCASTACELWVGSTDGVGEELLAADDRDLRVVEQPRRRGRVGRDEDPPHPGRVHVDAAQRVAQLVDLAVARGPVVAFADDVLRHLGGALPLELARRAVDPREDDVDGLGELVRLRVEHAVDRAPRAAVASRPSVYDEILRVGVIGAQERVVDRRLDESRRTARTPGARRATRRTAARRAA